MTINDTSYQTLVCESNRDAYKAMLWLKYNSPGAYKQLLHSCAVTWESGLPRKTPFSKWETEDERLALIIKAHCRFLLDTAEQKFFSALPAADADDILRLMGKHEICFSAAGHTYDAHSFFRRWQDYRPDDFLPVAARWE